MIGPLADSVKPAIRALRLGWIMPVAITFFIVAGTVTDAGEDKEKLRAFGADMIRSAQSAASGDPAKAAVKAAKTAIDYWLPAIGEDLPE